MNDRRFPRSSRLLTKKDYSHVFDQPRRSSDRYFTVLARTTGTTEPARLGLAVSKKVSKLAVVRNKIKRSVRESFRHHKTQLNGVDLVVIARPAAGRAGIPTLELGDALRRHWARFGLGR